MAIVNFPMLTNSQANPFLSGLERGSRLAGGMLKLPGQLKAQQLANAIAAVKAKYAEPLTKQDLQRAILNNMHQQQENTRYGEMTPLEVNKLYLANQFAKQMNPLKIQHQQLIDKFYPELIKSQIQWRNNAGFGRGGVFQQELNDLRRQIQADFPQYSNNPQKINDITNAYLSDNDTLPSGERLPVMSASAKYIITNLRNKNSTAAIQNNAANLTNTLDELKNIDITPVVNMAGIKGKVNYLYQKINPSERTQEWRDYDLFRNQTSTLVMDSLRQALKTSVVPQYVKDTIGHLSNPNDEIWDDPKQVKLKWNKIIEWVERAAGNAVRQAQFGPTALSNNSFKYKPDVTDEYNLEYDLSTGNFK